MSDYRESFNRIYRRWPWHRRWRMQIYAAWVATIDTLKDLWYGAPWEAKRGLDDWELDETYHQITGEEREAKPGEPKRDWRYWCSTCECWHPGGTPLDSEGM